MLDYFPDDEALYPAVPLLLHHIVERRRAAERSRRASQHQTEVQSLLAAVLCSVITPIIITDGEDRVRMLNPAVTATFGWPLPQAMGHPLSASLHHGSPGELDAFRCKEASDKPVALSLAPLRIEGRSWKILTVLPIAPLAVALPLRGPSELRSRISSASAQLLIHRIPNIAAAVRARQAGAQLITLEPSEQQPKITSLRHAAGL